MSDAQNENDFAADFEEDSKNVRPLTGQQFAQLTIVENIFVGEGTSTRIVLQRVDSQEQAIPPAIGLSRGPFREPVEVPGNIARPDVS